MQRTTVAVCLAVCLGAALSASAGAVPLRYHQQLTALYVIDHNGANPPSDLALVVYSTPMEKILASCRTDADDLTNRVLDLADQASAVGGRDVTSLQMLQAIARRISWPSSNPHGCGYIYDLAEAHMETGGP